MVDFSKKVLFTRAQFSNRVCAILMCGMSGIGFVSLI